ncbi:MAG: hypothetical protein PHY93_08530 [Bacteriovorax sp.]|nr:hypothetical protein [Bacteriovorax sp.]
MTKKSRTSSDYPQFSFRITADLKEQLNNMIDEVVDLYNKNVPDGEYLYRKNEIIIEALEIGLTQMKKNPGKKSIRK